MTIATNIVTIDGIKYREVPTGPCKTLVCNYGGGNRCVDVEYRTGTSLERIVDADEKTFAELMGF